jgi:MarR family transcriptional regulator for hemolysin
MVHMIDHLVKAGLVIREPSISDRRVNRIVITNAGHRVYAESKKLATAVRQQLIAGIDLEKLVHLTELLEQLQCILDAPRNSSPGGKSKQVPVRQHQHEAVGYGIWVDL